MEKSEGEPKLFCQLRFSVRSYLGLVLLRGIINRSESRFPAFSASFVGVSRRLQVQWITKVFEQLRLSQGSLSLQIAIVNNECI